jgi:hypothetical protein
LTFKIARILLNLWFDHLVFPLKFEMLFQPKSREN